MSFLKNLPFFIVLILLPVTVAFAANPGAPISPSDNIQDPGALSTPWGGCGPADSNCYVTVSGGDTIYTADGALTGNRIVTLDSNSLIFRQGTENFLTLDTTLNNEASWLQAFNTTADGNFAQQYAGTTANSALFWSKASFNDSLQTASIEGTVNNSGSDIVYSADTHNFSGNVGIGTATPSAALGIIKTTEQVRIGYDPTKYFKTTVDTNGNVMYELGQDSNWYWRNGIGSQALFIGRAADGYEAIIRSSDGDAQSKLSLRGDLVGNNVSFNLSADDDTNPTVSVAGDGVNGTLGYTATTHTFNGNVGIGDATPVALFTVGNGDLFNVYSGGYIVQSTDYSTTFSPAYTMDFTFANDGEGPGDAAAFDMIVTNTGTESGDILSGLYIRSLTGAHANVSETAIKIGSSWDNVFNINGTMLSYTEVQALDAGIELGDLTTQGTATDEYCLTSETGGGALLAWQSCGGGGTPSLTSGQIAFGDGSNLMTSSSRFTWYENASYPALIIGQGSAEAQIRIQSAVPSDYFTLSGYSGGIIYGSPTYQSVAIYPSAAAGQALRAYTSGGTNKIIDITAGLTVNDLVIYSNTKGVVDISRTFPYAASGNNPHGFTDQTVFRTGVAAFNSFGSFVTFGNTNPTTQDHYAAFQNVWLKDGTNTINKVYGFVNAVSEITGGTITDLYGYYHYSPTITSGTITNQYGIYIPAVTGATNNYAAYFGSNVGVGDTTPDYDLDVADTGTDGDIFSLTDSDGECLYNPEAGSVTVSCSSDERLKTNIKDTSSALEYFSGFTIRDYEVIASGDQMTGVIAQEILETHPELVSMGPNGMYSVELPNQWKVVKAIQELNIKVEKINNFESEDNSFLANLRHWLSSVENGIADFWADRIRAREEVCIGETCINEEELKAIIEESQLNNGDTYTTGQNEQPPAIEEESSVEPPVEELLEEIPTPIVEEESSTDSPEVVIPVVETNPSL